MVLASVALSGCIKKKTAQVEPTPSPVVQEKYNTIDVAQRPYVTLAPSNNGRSVVFTLVKMGKMASKGELEVEYQSGQLLQGFGGKLNVDKLPDKQEFLLGSCSAGGKCSYSEDVTGGSLVLRFTADERFALKNDWSFLENKEKADRVSSRDGKFSVTGKGFAANTHAIVLQSPGYPAPVEKPLSTVYTVGTLKPIKGEVKVSIRLSEDVPAAAVWAWDGSAWKPLKAAVTEKTATATSPQLYEAYVAVETE